MEKFARFAPLNVYENPVRNVQADSRTERIYSITRCKRTAGPARDSRDLIAVEEYERVLNKDDWQTKQTVSWT